MIRFDSRKFVALVISLELLAALGFSQERAIPNTPVAATITSYRITAFAFQREPDWRFTITFEDSNGKTSTDEHYGPSTRANPADGKPITNPEGAEDFLKQLNTSNFSSVSMTRRLLQHLVQHGKIPASTVTGTPEGVGL